MKADVYGSVIGVVRKNVSLTHEQALWLSERPEVQAVVCETSLNDLKTIYQDGMMRQWDPAGRIVSGPHAPFDNRIGWPS